VDLASQSVALFYDGGVRKSFDETLIARLGDKAPGGAIEILERLIHFIDSRHCAFLMLPL
jgi:hypothetical protein